MTKRKARKNKQRVLRLNLDKTFDEIKLSRENGQVKDGDNKVLMQPADVFTERKSPMYRGKRRIVLYVEGTQKPIRFKTVKVNDGKEKAEVEDMNPFWTVGEAKEFVNKTTTDSLRKNKPFTNMQVAVMAILLIIVIGLQIYSIATGNGLIG